MRELRKLEKVWSKLLVMGVKLSKKGSEVEVGKEGISGRLGNKSGSGDMRSRRHVIKKQPNRSKRLRGQYIGVFD